MIPIDIKIGRKWHLDSELSVENEKDGPWVFLRTSMCPLQTDLWAFHKHLLGKLDAKRGPLKVLTLLRGALKNDLKRCYKLSLYDLLWGWPIIFMSKGGNLKFTILLFFFASGPQQVIP